MFCVFIVCSLSLAIVFACLKSFDGRFVVSTRTRCGYCHRTRGPRVGLFVVRCCHSAKGVGRGRHRGEFEAARTKLGENGKDLVCFRLLSRASQKLDVVGATSGAQALELAKSNRFDLVLLDLFMPVRTRTGFVFKKEESSIGNAGEFFFSFCLFCSPLSE